jgi:hypothetical protein
MDPNYTFRQMLAVCDTEDEARAAALKIVQQDIPNWTVDRFRTSKQIDDDVEARMHGDINILIWRDRYESGNYWENGGALNIALRYGYTVIDTWPVNADGDAPLLTAPPTHWSVLYTSDDARRAQSIYEIWDVLRNMQSFARAHYGRDLHVQNNTALSLPDDGFFGDHETSE